MLFIESNWRLYFTDPNEGLGTTYERFILHRYFEKIRRGYDIASIIEVPAFGMTGVSGINSLWWAAHGIPVTVIDHDEERVRLIETVWRDTGLTANIVHQEGYGSLPYKDRAFDLAWNFASLWFVPEPGLFLTELTRVTKKVLFICVPNSSGLPHRLRFAGKDSHSGLFMENILPGTITGLLSGLKWKLVEHGFFDVPPWPDIAMKKEDLLRKMGLQRLVSWLGNEPGAQLCILDYFNGRNRRMDEQILRYGFLENMPALFKRLWAHHRYLVFRPESPEA